MGEARGDLRRTAPHRLPGSREDSERGRKCWNAEGELDDLEEEL